MHQPTSTIILGAGAIGCFLAGHWTAGGIPVTLFARPERGEELKRSGLKLTGGKAVSISGPELDVSCDPLAFSQANLIIICVKYHSLATVGELLSPALGDATKILCLLNGVQPLLQLRQRFGKNTVLGGMVPFNVVWKGQGTLHRSSAGTLMAESSSPTHALSKAAAKSGVPIKMTEKIEPIQYGKLLLNLNNAINALSGETLFNQLTLRKYRLIYAAALKEALSIYAKAEITHQKVGPFSPSMVTKILRAPNFIFNPLVTRLQKIDRDSKTSMATDLELGKQTEIEILNGEIVSIAKQMDIEAPINAKLVQLIRMAQAGGRSKFSADELATQLDLD